jgi:riboflavin biosynthesis pyrimidine reductase
MRNFELLFDDGEPSPVEAPVLAPYGKLGFPPPPPERPWIYSNFVQSLDGIVSFKGRHPLGSDISQSEEDRWLMDVLRTYADAIILGLNTLREETRITGGRGPVYWVENAALQDLRGKLGRRRQKNIFVSGTLDFDFRAYRVFDGDLVEPLIVTTTDGLNKLLDQPPPATTRVVVAGEGTKVDLPKAITILRSLGIEYLLCEGGPTLYGHMSRAGLIDEKFLTVSPLEIGLFPPSGEEAGENEKRALRPTTFMAPGFDKEDAPWWRWLSCRRAGDHQFNRYRRIRNRD